MNVKNNCKNNPSRDRQGAVLLKTPLPDGRGSDYWHDIIFVNGILSQELSDNSFTLISSAEGLFLNIPKNTIVSKPIHLIFTNTQSTALKNIIMIDESAEVDIIEEYISDAENYVTNVVTEIHAGKNARVRFHKIQDEHLSATHTATIVIKQQQDSRVELFSLSKGARLERENVQVNLSATGAECHLSGLYSLMHDDQYVEHHLHVDHIAEHGTSSMLYKGILDKKSRAEFKGKVYVHPHAQHTNAFQANHNVLLSKNAEVNTKPELEIYADDVKCTHGATVGQLDTEALFYLCSRGIDKDTALRILLNAFADDVLNKISQSSIREYIQQRVGNYVEL